MQTEQGEIEAVTENISANGLLFVSDRLPALDSKIEFTIDMPSAVMGSETDVTIHCIGRVVRHYLNGDEKKAADCRGKAEQAYRLIDKLSLLPPAEVAAVWPSATAWQQLGRDRTIAMGRTFATQLLVLGAGWAHGN